MRATAIAIAMVEFQSVYMFFMDLLKELKMHPHPNN